MDWWNIWRSRNQRKTTLEGCAKVMVTFGTPKIGKWRKEANFNNQIFIRILFRKWRIGNCSNLFDSSDRELATRSTRRLCAKCGAERILLDEEPFCDEELSWNWIIYELLDL